MHIFWAKISGYIHYVYCLHEESTHFGLKVSINFDLELSVQFGPKKIIQEKLIKVFVHIFCSKIFRFLQIIYCRYVLKAFTFHQILYWFLSLKLFLLPFSHRLTSSIPFYHWWENRRWENRWEKGIDDARLWEKCNRTNFTDKN